MTERKVEQILRSHIRRIIKEEGGDFGGGGYDIGWGNIGGGGMGGGGIWGYGIGDNLGKFLEPFTDVLKTAIGKTKELSIKAQTLAAVAWEGLATTIVPWLSSDYSDIFRREKQEINRLKQEYGDVYKRTWDAFKNEDFLITAFFYDPASMLATVGITQAPTATKELLSILSGGRLDDLLGRIMDKFGNKSAPGGPGEYNRHMKYEGIIHEQQDDAGESLEKVLANPKLIDAACSSQYAQKMMSDGRTVVNGVLKDAVDHVMTVFKAHSVQDIEREMGKKLPEKIATSLAKMQPAERQKSEAIVIKQLQKLTKESVVNDLSKQVKVATKSGVPNNSPFIQAYMKTISKIRAM